MSPTALFIFHSAAYSVHSPILRSIYRCPIAGLFISKSLALRSGKYLALLIVCGKCASSSTHRGRQVCPDDRQRFRRKGLTIAKKTALDRGLSQVHAIARNFLADSLITLCPATHLAQLYGPAKRLKRVSFDAITEDKSREKEVTRNMGRRD